VQRGILERQTQTSDYTKIVQAEQTAGLKHQLCENVTNGRVDLSIQTWSRRNKQLRCTWNEIMQLL